MRFLLFLLFCTFYLFSAGIENFRAGGRSLALSGASVSFSDLWSSFNNQAGITGINQVTGGVFYESGFFLKELSTVAGAVILPTKTGNFAFSFCQFGRNSFKEEKLGLAFGKSLGNLLKAGVQFDYFFISLPENERPKGFTTFEAGIICSPDNSLSLGIHLFNPVRGGIQYQEGEERAPLILAAGGHYLFNPSLLVSIAGEKSSGQPICIKSGVEWTLLNALAFRFGISGKPLRYTTGIGYKKGRIQVDTGFSYHNTLGMTPSISMQYSFR